MADHTPSSTIAIVGAGPAGCATALRLSQLGIACTLFDKAVFPRDKVCGDGLSGWTVTLLKRLCPDTLKEVHTHLQATPSWGVRFSAPNACPLEVPFSEKERENATPPGYVLPRYRFDELLVNACKENPLIDYQEATEVKQTGYSAEKGHSLLLKQPSGTRLAHFPLVIFANGAYSAEAKRLAGIYPEKQHYVAGVRAYYEQVKGMHADGYIELHFVKKLLPGYLWIFPLPDGRANVGLGVRSDYISKKRLNLKLLLEELLTEDPRFKDRFVQARLLTKIQGYGLPLGSKRRPISGDGFLLTGDAAALIDPFTGEGIGNALASGELAANIAAQALEKGDFSAHTLAAYDEALYRKLGKELQLSRMMQELLRFPSLFNWLVKKANNNAAVRETLSCMLTNLDVRQLLSRPSFYFRLLFNK